MSTTLLIHLQTWSAQALLLTAAGALAALTLTNAKARLLFWQGILLALLLLPAVEPWQHSPVVVVRSSPGTAVVSTVAAGATKPDFRLNWLLLIVAGAGLRVVWIAAGFLRLRGYRTRATRLTEPPFRFDSSSARWYVSDSLPGPVTYGWRRPSILLPTRVMELPSALREAIACHELMHVRRRDWLFVLAEEIVRSLLWFHPGVWYVLSRIQLAREQVVDGEVVRLTENRDCYLDALLEVAEHSLHPSLRPSLAPAPLFLKKRHLAVRVAAVLKEVSMPKSQVAVRLTAAFSAIFAAAVVAVWFVPFVSSAQTVMDDAGVTVDAGATLIHRAPVHNPGGASGTVTVEASLNARGEVTDAHVLNGPDDLRKEALSSVLQWHYTPGLSRVQISMRFDPVAPESRKGTEPRVVAGVPGGRGVFVQVPPQAGAATVLTVRGIEFDGFSAEGERELRSRLTIREGDPLTAENMARASAEVQEFDSHAVVRTMRGVVDSTGGAGATLRITVLPGAVLAMAVPPPPPPPPPGASSVPGVRAIGGAVMQANRIKIVTPAYPPLAKSARIQGAVVLQVIIAQDGTVQSAELVSGHPLLVAAAKDAVMQWIYKPTLLNGEPVSVQTDVTVNFTLTQ